MFPKIELFWYTIYFQWLWIILATLAFIYWVYRYSKKYNLRFPYFFSFLSFFIILPYFLGRYVYDFIEYKFFFPVDIVNLLSPYDYRFSFIWVSLGLLIVTFAFLLSMQYRQERKKWFDVLFFSITLSLVVIGPFLLLGDNFYGTLTNTEFGVTPFTPDTQIPYTSAIWPVGMFVSILWIILYILAKIVVFVTKKPWTTIFLLPLLFWGFAYIFTFQQYPKHFLFWIDIKIFYSVLMWILSPIVFYILTKSEKNS